MTSIEEIEKNISKFLQKNIIFTIEHKTLKKGRLLLFCVKDFFCTFTLLCEEKNNKKIVYEIPYPFDVVVLPNKLVFDYTVRRFCKNSAELEESVKKILPEKPSKIFNKKITITSL
jgi:hypothetical protein